MKNHRTEKKEAGEKRVLTAAEQKRSERFAAITEEMKQKGYTCRDLTIGIGKANLFAALLLIPLFVIGFGLCYLVHRQMGFSGFNMLAFTVTFLVLVVVHELIHGVCWSIFTPHHFKDIEFGFIKEKLTPYCTCLEPLKKEHYIFGAVMPLVVLGLLPMIVGIAIGNSTVLLLGIVMADTAAGDILIIRRILGYRSIAGDIVYMDHPTEAGGVIFER